MRLRKKWWARPEMEASSIVITRPFDKKGLWKEEFGNSNPIHLELGCGRGKFICEKAKENPNINYIAIDLKDEVLVYGIRKVQEAELSNVRFIPMNIGFIADVFDKDEISKIYINFCNPWPKKSHNKRRLTHTKLLTEYKKFIKPETEIWFKTDDVDLFEASLDYFKDNSFSLEFVTYDLHQSGFDKNIMTEYEEKFTSLGMKTMFLIGKLNTTN